MAVAWGLGAATLVAGVAAVWYFRRPNRRKLVEALANRERATEPRGWWWLSFVDPSKPEGFSFLGVAIVEGNGVGSAALRAHELGVNPGGDVRAYRIAEADIPAQQYRNRLLSMGELNAAGILVDRVGDDKHP